MSVYKIFSAYFSEIQVKGRAYCYIWLRFLNDGDMTSITKYTVVRGDFVLLLMFNIGNKKIEKYDLVFFTLNFVDNTNKQT